MSFSRMNCFRVICPHVSCQISSPAAQVDAADDDFAVSSGDQCIHFADDSMSFERPAVPANKGNHAKGATIVAAVLHFEIGTGALVGGIEDGRGQQFGVSEDVGD